MYKLFLVKPDTGQIILSTGEHLNTDQRPDYSDTFETLEEATKEKDVLLKKLNWGLVQIYNESKDEEMFYSNKEVQKQYMEEINKLNCYLALPWYKKVFTSRPALNYVKT